MRKLLFTLLAVGLVAAPTMASVSIQVSVSPSTISVGQTATVTVQVMGTSSVAVASAAGSVAAGTSGIVTASAGTFNFGTAAFHRDPAGQFPEVVGTANASGGWDNFGSGQNTQLMNTNSATYGMGAYVGFFQYTVTGAAGGTTTLNFVPGAVGGFLCISTDSDQTIAGNQGASITVTAPNQNTVTAATVDNAVTAKKTFWRTKKNVIRLTFSQALASAPTAGQIKIFQCLAGGVEGADLSSNFTCTLESGGTVVKMIDSSTSGVLVNRTWYAIRIGTLPNTNSILSSMGHELLVPVLVGDTDGNGIMSAAGDVNPIVAKLSSPSVSPNDADRRDLDGNMIISAAADVNPCVANLSPATLPAKPAGW